MLSLIVVDEAHMIYLWGLVASKHSKNLIIFARLEDQAIFRPAYGHIGTRLTATNDVPVLLLSATCRPEAVVAITSSLMLTPIDIRMIDGELTRPEIRFIRVYMNSTLSSCDDLLRLFGPDTLTPADRAVPMIIYSGTRNRTFQVMKVVNEARKTPKHEYDPLDPFIRRYHSVTGDTEKQRTIEDFGEAKVPVISATMALGLGQNLKRVRCVVHMGRGDPAAIVQMVGRCGRDGRVGLGILFMEPSRKNGKNNVSDFGDTTYQDDDSRMDALAVTPCCLRIALTVDNKDPNFIKEKAEEARKGFSKCLCSNCAPKDAERLLDVIQQMNVNNFDAMLGDPHGFDRDPMITTMTRKRKTPAPKGSCRLPLDLSNDLVQHLVARFEDFYYDRLGPKAGFAPTVFFGCKQAQSLVDHFDQIRTDDHADIALLDWAIGGECFPGQINFLNEAISEWMTGVYYQEHQRSLAALDLFIEAEGRRVRDSMAAELEQIKVNAQAKRDTIKQDQARARAEEKARASELRVAERLRLAADRAQERALMAEERAAEEQWVQSQKRARKALEKKMRTGPQGPASTGGQKRNDCMDSLQVGARGGTTNGGGRANKLDEQQRMVEERANRRAKAAEANRLDLAEKQAARDARRARADETRSAQEIEGLEAKRRRVEDIATKKKEAEEKRTMSAREHVARTLRKSQVIATMEEVRAELAGGPRGEGDLHGNHS
ncbi:hypothetical protein PGT21_036268 [Puccinia graminis f. sp. tritici]|uniref:DNA 3'-5' helicase n=1 Tax=Puccinia graminis f. sp. tritici TaxID=56615 RepID=A0A5B0PAA3_PUCGR|nr:hypothetical protein PGT21_036268 [Puccinia graminis f. sp. tritici]